MDARITSGHDENRGPAVRESGNDVEGWAAMSPTFRVHNVNLNRL